MKHGLRKTILITGASSGLGEGMARQFAARGRDLALCARRVERLEALRAELLRQYPQRRIQVHALDVNDHDAVFSTFRASAQAFGGLDRVIVNAGVGEGRRIGKGQFALNLRIVQTNFTAALAQCEAALEIFRAQQGGHLVTIASVSAVRGLPRHMTAYAASKAGLAALTEGIRADLLGSPIKVSTIYPGYVRTEINAHAAPLPFELDATRASALLVRAIEREPAQAFVPAWPWAVIGRLMRIAPLRIVARAV